MTCSTVLPHLGQLAHGTRLVARVRIRPMLPLNRHWRRGGHRSHGPGGRLQSTPRRRNGRRRHAALGRRRRAADLALLLQRIDDHMQIDATAQRGQLAAGSPVGGEVVLQLFEVAATLDDGRALAAGVVAGAGESQLVAGHLGSFWIG